MAAYGNYRDNESDNDDGNDSDDYVPGDDYDPGDYDDQEEEEENRAIELANYLKTLTVGKEYRRYGYFNCTSPECTQKKSWQSANVFCKYEGEGIFKPLYRQACKTCKIMTLPIKHYKLQKPEGVVHDVEKPHLASLCERCQSGKPCRRA